MRIVRIRIQPSRQLYWIRCAILLWLMLLLWQQFGWLWGSLLSCIAPVILPLPQIPYAIQINQQGRFFIAFNHDDEWQNIELNNGIILAKMIFCRYHTQNSTHTLLLFSDQMDNIDWRHLQSRIRWCKIPRDN